MTPRCNRRALRGTLAALFGLPLASAALAVSAAAAATTSLSAQLLTTSDLPSGWAATVTSTAGGVGCLSKLLAPGGVIQTATATASFRHSSGTPELFETLATYANTSRAYAKAVSKIEACHSVNADPGGDPTTGTVSTLPFASLGDKSHTFVARLDVAGLKVEEVFVVVLQGSDLMVLDEASLTNTVNLKALTAIAKTAVAKLG